MMALIGTHDPVGPPTEAHEAGDLANAEDPDSRPEALRQTGHTSHAVNLVKLLSCLEIVESSRRYHNF